jgi:hypothetical protein
VTATAVASRPAVAVRGVAYDWVAVVASAWLLGGLFWDGWAHGYSLPDSFFTIWHAAFYSGFLASALVILGPAIIRAPAIGLRASVPAGYGWAAIGVLVFGFGGVFDLVWHTAFGIESNLDALFSPSHLVLGTGMALIVSGPLRAAWARRESGVPAVISITMLLSLFTFFSLFAGPYSTVLGANPRPGGGTENVIARSLLGMYLFSGLVVGCALVALRRGTLPVGAMTLLVGLNGIAMILMRGHASLQVQVIFSVVAIGAGIVGDLLLWRLRPSSDRLAALRAFAFAVPVAYFTLYFTAVLALAGTWWTVHFLTGSIVLSGVVGLLTSYVFAGSTAELPAVPRP